MSLAEQASFARRSLQLKDVQTAALDRSSEKLEKRPWYILNPEAKGMGYWDALTTVALIFTAIVTPVEVSFLPAPTSALDPLFCINRLVDAVFIVDMTLQFFLMVKIIGEATGPDDAGGVGVPVAQHRHALP